MEMKEVALTALQILEEVMVPVLVYSGLDEEAARNTAVNFISSRMQTLEDVRGLGSFLAKDVVSRLDRDVLEGMALKELGIATPPSPDL